ncbi:protein of unknown function [Methylotuvimicrobium alcaliphilum 20Z]|uniref:Uncharacterized protein n=1 Tax=Methylotuvimicrobium alcaliphilum (strain DSM 19304 / NCIMB 14124 / VKM B-2133 / 20Z) TaxID=1091494 RepID=G4T470_META2|nr:protein of unknown function [Methylotuvimicrobium alcaliphilum 20Z]
MPLCSRVDANADKYAGMVVSDRENISLGRVLIVTESSLGCADSMNPSILIGVRESPYPCNWN